MGTQNCIDLSCEDWSFLQMKKKCYFGIFDIKVDNNYVLIINIEFKKDLVSGDLKDQIQIIQKNEFNLTKKFQLKITNQSMTIKMKKYFANVLKLGQFFKDNIQNNNIIVIFKQKFILKIDKNSIQIPYELFKQTDRSQLLKVLQRYNEIFTNFQQKDMWALDTELLMKVNQNIKEQDILSIQSGSNDSLTCSQDSSQQESQTSSVQKQKQSVVSQNKSIQTQTNKSYQKPDQPYRQKQIPIYQRFHNIDINLPKKQKLRLAQKMLQIGYCKQDIIRLFSSGADAMEAQQKHIPDYRNPNSQKYKQIHLIVAKKQYQRHCSLLRKYGQPLIPPLPEYKIDAREVQRGYQDSTKRILIQLLKQKRYKRFQDIQRQILRQGGHITMQQLKNMIQELRIKANQRKNMNNIQVISV